VETRHVLRDEVSDIPIDLPDDSNTGWLGLVWILVAMVPASIGGGILRPCLNSLITKRVEASEVGGILGVSAAFLSAANALAPFMGGAIFQALGSSALFLAWGTLMGLLLVAALLLVKPGHEELMPAGLVRGGTAH